MPRLAWLALLVPLASSACASFGPSYRDFAPEAPPDVAKSDPSPEAEAAVAAFYGPRGADAGPAIDAALARAPRHGGLHEVAAYRALLLGDTHAAIHHFLAAAADPDAVSPEIYLWEASRLEETVVERLTAMELYRAVRERHPSPAARAVAAFALAREHRVFAEPEEAALDIASLGFIEPWSIVGAFDNDQNKGFATAYPPEDPRDTSTEYAGVRVPVRFRPASASRLDGALPLGDLVYPSDSSVAYAETFVHADEARSLQLRLTTTNDVRAFLDGRLVASDDKIFHDELDNLTVPVSLGAGWHKLLIKSAHGSGGWRLGARFTDTDGRVATGLRFQATSPGPTPVLPPGEATAALVPLGRIDKLADPNRKRFLTARLWARQGHTRRPVTFFQPFLDAAPDNPLAQLFTALGRWDNAEAGKALDLLNHGVSANPRLPAFLIERGRFYAQRRLWDKAMKDFNAAFVLDPHLRDAVQGMADIDAARGWPIDRCHELEQAVARWPDSPALHADRAQCQDDLGYAGEADRSLRRASSLAPGDARILRRLAQLADRRNEYEEAISRFHALRAVFPTSVGALLDEADLQRRAGHLDEARRLIGEARDESPDSPRPYKALAALAWEAGSAPLAVDLYRQALDRDPDDSALSERVASLSPTAPPLGERLAATVDDIDRAVREADHVAADPGSHYVVLLDDEVVTVNPDGSSRRIITWVAQALNTEGRDALIQARLPASGRVRVMEAYSLKKDGERQEASSVSSSLIRYRALDVGSIVVRKFVHYAPPPRFLPNEWAQNYYFQYGNAQVKEARWRLILPPDRKLGVVKRGEIEQSTELREGKKIWSFAVHNAPPLVPEAGMPPFQDAAWMAAVSTSPTWDAYVRWELALLSDAFPPGDDLDRLAQKLVAGATTPREKLDRLFAWVAQEIRYQQEYEDTIAGVKPHAASIVVERGYGDCKDKAVLLIRLGRAVGLDLRFAILRTTPQGKVLREIPNQQFNHAIVYAPKQPGIDEAMFIDPTTNGLDVGNLRTDDQGATSLVVDPRSGAWEFLSIPYQEPDREITRHTVSIDLHAPDKARASDKIELRGERAAGLRVVLRSGEGAKKAYQALSEQLFPGTTLREGKSDHAEDITRPLALSLDIDMANAVQSEGDRFRLNVPLFFPLGQRATLTTRRLPLELPRGAVSVELSAEIGEDVEVFHLPADLDVTHACFSLKRQSKLVARKVQITTEYRESCAEVAPEDYAGFRAAVQKVVVKSQESLIFGPRAKGPPGRGGR